mmetsp:Transcript_58570/g.162096  ORF Transcript_58570/g.162096 Transcript_58570/m.162096 type:complete len:253 (+) Transcript_58570:271-1029(+)
MLDHVLDGQAHHAVELHEAPELAVVGFQGALGGLVARSCADVECRRRAVAVGCSGVAAAAGVEQVTTAAAASDGEQPRWGVTARGMLPDELRPFEELFAAELGDPEGRVAQRPRAAGAASGAALLGQRHGDVRRHRRRPGALLFAACGRAAGRRRPAWRPRAPRGAGPSRQLQHLAGASDAPDGAALAGRHGGVTWRWGGGPVYGIVGKIESADVARLLRQGVRKWDVQRRTCVEFRSTACRGDHGEPVCCA